MLEFLDREFRVGSRLLLRLDDFVQLTQLRVEPRQCRTLFLQPAFRLPVLSLSLRFGVVLGGTTRGLAGNVVSRRVTHLALRNFIHERLEVLAHLVDPCGRTGERIARRGDVGFNLFYMGAYFRDDRKRSNTCTNQAPASRSASLFVESSRPQLVSAASPFASVCSTTKGSH